MKEVQIYGVREWEKMKEAGILARSLLDFIHPYVQPGVSTNALNDLCHNFIIRNNAIPSSLNYCGFPKSICTSVNETVCHGVPSDQVLISGDIVNIDVTLMLDGWHADTSRTFPVGKVSETAERIISKAYETMMEGIKMVKAGNTIGDIGARMEEYSLKHGYNTVKEYCGHGIGLKLHEEPKILNYGTYGKGMKLKEGMIFTVEPMINLGTDAVKLLADEITVVTEDGLLSAQFEHTVGVTKNGYIIFT